MATKKFFPTVFAKIYILKANEKGFKNGGFICLHRYLKRVVERKRLI